MNTKIDECPGGEKEQTCQRLADEVIAHDARARGACSGGGKPNAHAQSLAHEVAAQDVNAQRLTADVVLGRARGQKSCTGFLRRADHEQ